MMSSSHTCDALSPSLKYLLGAVITLQFLFFQLLWNA